MLSEMAVEKEDKWHHIQMVRVSLIKKKKAEETIGQQRALMESQ